MVWAQFCFAVLALFATICATMRIQKTVSEKLAEDSQDKLLCGFVVSLWMTGVSALYWLLAYFAGAFDRIAPKFWE